MSDGMGRELAYLSSHATNRYFIPNWGITKFNLTKLHHKNGISYVLLHYLTPPTQIGYKSCCGNFSQPI